MSIEQEMAYCTATDGVRIAYATYGNAAAPPLVYIPDIPNQEATWASPWGRQFLLELAQQRRLITLDPRGFGASNTDGDVSPLAQSSDVATVVDHLRLARYELCSGGWVPSTWSILHTGTHEQSVSKLVLFSPRVSSSATVIATAETVRESYPIFLRSLATLFFPSGPPEMQRWFSSATRESVNAQAFASTIEWTYDLAPILARLAIPTLILHRKRSQVSDLAQARSVASLITGARLVVVAGDSGALYSDYEQVIDTVREFLGSGTGASAAVARSGTVVILFTDLVDHTRMMQRLGDERGRDVLREHERITREALAAHGGSEVKTDGDSFMASFASVSAGVECAVALQRAFAQHNETNSEPIVVRMGLNVGEPIEEGGDYFGSAVILGARIKDQAGSGEILVPEAVRHMLSGKSFVFSDRGEFALKGFEDAVRLYEVQWQP